MNSSTTLLAETLQTLWHSVLRPIIEGIATIAILWFLYWLFVARHKDAAEDEGEVKRGRKLMSLLEAKRKAHHLAWNQSTGIPWGGILVPDDAAARFVVVGESGSGKSLTFSMVMKYVLSRIEAGSDRRALIFDYKRALLSNIVGANPDCPVIITNPFDSRCSAWDIGKDITSPASALQVATLLIPPDQNATQPFFTNAARDVVASVIRVFIERCQSRWRFADVILACQSLEQLHIVLSQTQASLEVYATYFNSAERGADILATISTKITPLSPIAACWQRATALFSLKDWIQSETILLLSSDPENQVALDALNRVIFQRTSELVLSQPDSVTRSTWFFLDEISLAGRLDGIRKLAVASRSRGARLAISFQDIQGMRSVYGDREADEITAQCSTVAVLRLSSPATARWAADLFGTAERVEVRTSESSGKSDHGSSSGTTESDQLVSRDAVLPSEFMSLPPVSPTNGLSGYYVVPEIGAYTSTLSSSWLTERLCPTRSDVAAHSPRPESDQYLIPWSEDDLRRLKLVRSEEVGSPATETPPSSGLASIVGYRRS